MLNKTFIVLLLFVLSASAAFAQATAKPKSEKTETWYQLNSTEGEFSVLMPAKPKFDSNTIESAVGNIKVNMYSVYAAPTVFMVAYNDYPFSSEKPEEIDAILDAGRDSGIRNVNGKLVSEKKITLDNYPGREIVAKGKLSTGDPINIKLRVFLVKNRLYQLLSLTSGRIDAPEIDKYLQSFELTQ